jgi:excisionase family DNA binding protein
MTPRLISLREAAAYLGVKHPTLYALAVRGEIAFVEFPSSGGKRRGRILFDVADLDAAIARWRKEAAV